MDNIKVNLSEGESFVYKDNNITLTDISYGAAKLHFNSVSHPDWVDVAAIKENETDCFRDIRIKVLETPDVPQGTPRYARINISYSDFSELFLGDIGQTAYDVESFDFDGDGDIDIFSIYSPDNSVNGGIKVFVNNEGSFEEAEKIFYGNHRLQSFEAGDFDNDGDKDFLISYGETIYDGIDFTKDFSVVKILEYEPNPEAEELGDMFTLREEEVLRYGEQTEGFVPYNHRIKPYLAIGDYDNDGDVDFVVGDNSGIVNYFENLGGFSFKDRGKIFDFGKISWGLASGDLNNDSKIDLLVSSGKKWGWFWMRTIYYKENKGEITPEPQRPQSKIVNKNSFDVTGDLVMKLQKKEGNRWVDKEVVTSQKVNVPSQGLIKLDVGEDFGWNLKEVRAESKGDYRVYVNFEYKGESIEDSWEFEVK